MVRGSRRGKEWERERGRDQVEGEEPAPQVGDMNMTTGRTSRIEPGLETRGGFITSALFRGVPQWAEVPPAPGGAERMEMGGKTRPQRGALGWARQEMPWPEMHLAAESRNFTIQSFYQCCSFCFHDKDKERGKQPKNRQNSFLTSDHKKQPCEETGALDRVCRKSMEPKIHPGFEKVTPGRSWQPAPPLPTPTPGGKITDKPSQGRCQHRSLQPLKQRPVPLSPQLLGQPSRHRLWVTGRTTELSCFE